MQNWEYAAGYQDLNDKFVASTEPGTYEKARIDLDTMIRRHEDEDWMIAPSIIRRCDRYPEWQQVDDHAAELLAEVFADASLDFGVHGAGIMQGSDLAKALRKIALNIKNKLPQRTEEYGE